MQTQFWFDDGIGPADDGSKLTTNVQPVIPFDIGENWNLVTRTIVSTDDEEIAAVGRAFNDMAAELAAGYEDLADVPLELSAIAPIEEVACGGGPLAR